ncbi:WecB/TagA/CpsF family glycosyltransferase [Rhizohabitans arisaemae]|uniref:WecB/TagA/CpsF family glycosyltransferase n=1 Tax=Rhizohabitans arisaemae TaxID=2720610 RepID=UPI0024B0E733|nr:WecB/TagA/CpsF family glycosyltransferase [Rhizohabitans arisaemae]
MAAERSDRVRIAGIALDAMTEYDVVEHLVAAVRGGRGGHIVTPNVDICRRARRDARLGELLARADIAVPDGMPLVWAARLGGQPLPERVTGSALIWSLSAAAAGNGLSVYLLGGAPGVPEQAARALAARHPGLVVAGVHAPPFGFDRIGAEGIEEVRGRLLEARPDIVFVGLGFPRQDLLIDRLRPVLPKAWFLGCGSAISFAAGEVRRAPLWMQQAGLEWLWRLGSEPRRLARRYLVDDLPFAVHLLATSWLARLTR